MLKYMVNCEKWNCMDMSKVCVLISKDCISFWQKLLYIMHCLHAYNKGTVFVWYLWEQFDTQYMLNVMKMQTWGFHTLIISKETKCWNDIMPSNYLLGVNIFIVIIVITQKPFSCHIQFNAFQCNAIQVIKFLL